MKKSKFTESQILETFQEAESSVSVAEVCRKRGISVATFYRWKRKYAGMTVSELKRVKELEAENARLKRIFYGPDKDHSQRPKLLKSILTMTAAILLWSMSIVLTSLLPEFLNPRLSNIVVAIVGAITLALRFYLKKRFNIKSATMGPTRY